MQLLVHQDLCMHACTRIALHFKRIKSQSRGPWTVNDRLQLLARISVVRDAVKDAVEAV